jgi:hypothetical protein
MQGIGDLKDAKHLVGFYVREETHLKTPQRATAAANDGSYSCELYHK